METMNVAGATDLVVVGYALTMSAVYGLREPFLAYPISAVLVALLWETLGWHGAASLTVILAVVLSILLALFTRAARRLSLFSLKPANMLSATGIMASAGAVWMLLAAGIAAIAAR
jgi:hypothetical protein